MFVTKMAELRLYHLKQQLALLHHLAGRLEIAVMAYAYTVCIWNANIL